jgi:hypothetical protein
MLFGGNGLSGLELQFFLIFFLFLLSRRKIEKVCDRRCPETGANATIFCPETGANATIFCPETGTNATIFLSRNWGQCYNLSMDPKRLKTISKKSFRSFTRNTANYAYTCIFITSFFKIYDTFLLKIPRL